MPGFVISHIFPLLRFSMILISLIPFCEMSKCFKIPKYFSFEFFAPKMLAYTVIFLWFSTSVARSVKWGKGELGSQQSWFAKILYGMKIGCFVCWNCCDYLINGWHLSEVKTWWEWKIFRGRVIPSSLLQQNMLPAPCNLEQSLTNTLQKRSPQH